MSNIIQQQERQAITTLGDLFDLADIGEGNAVAGLNTLTMMALTLANMVPSESRLVHKTGTETIGCGFLAAGPLASSHFNEVFDSLLEVQNNICLNKEDMLLAIEREAAKPSDLQAFKSGLMVAAPKYPAMLTFLQSDQPDTALEIMFEPPHFMPELVRRPLVVVRTSDSRQLLAAAAGAHSGRLLAAVPVATGEQAIALGRSIMSLRDGILVPGAPLRSVCGCISASIGFGALAAGISRQHEDAFWLTTLPWLCDGNDKSPPLKTGGYRASHVWPRFKALVKKAFRRRLAGQPLDISTTNGCRSLLARHMGDLADIEPQFPGISSVARKLPASLAYGLLWLLHDLPPSNREAVVKDCFNTALSIVKRMASIRTQIDDNSGERKLRVLAVRIAAKLEVQPCDARALTRKCHRHGIDRCRSALALLREYGCAVEQNGSWQLTRPAGEVVGAVGKVLDV